MKTMMNGIFKSRGVTFSEYFNTFWNDIISTLGDICIDFP